MKKRILDIDALAVESFEVAAPRRDSRGTVLAAEATPTLPPYCITFTCGDSQIRPCLAD